MGSKVIPVQCNEGPAYRHVALEGGLGSCLGPWGPVFPNLGGTAWELEQGGKNCPVQRSGLGRATGTRSNQEGLNGVMAPGYGKVGVRHCPGRGKGCVQACGVRVVQRLNGMGVGFPKLVGTTGVWNWAIKPVWAIIMGSTVPRSWELLGETQSLETKLGNKQNNLGKCRQSGCLGRPG